MTDNIDYIKKTPGMDEHIRQALNRGIRHFCNGNWKTQGHWTDRKHGEFNSFNYSKLHVEKCRIKILIRL